MRWTAAWILLIACTPARAPERPLHCSLDPAISSFAAGAEPITCGPLASNVEGPPDCADRIRDAVKAHRSFVAIWEQPKYDGEIARHAIAARSEDAGYDLRWFEYTFVSRCGPPGNCGDRAHEGWTSRRCSAIGDHFECVDATPADECRD